MGTPIGGLLVRLDLEEMVVFNAAEEDLAVFSRPGFHFPPTVVETIGAAGVVASLGPSTSTNFRRLRLRDSRGEVIFDERIFVYLT